MKPDKHLIRYHHDFLWELKKTFENESDFLEVVGYLQCNVPLGVLNKLVEDGPWDKTVKEFSPKPPPLYWGAKDPFQVLDDLDKYIDGFSSVLERGYSFMFFGANGSGKSMAALYILCTVLERGHSGYYINFKDYMTLYNSVVFGDPTAAERYLWRYIYSTQILVLDELGKESNTTANVIGELESLIKFRTNRNLPTIMVSNLPLTNGNSNTFEKKYGNSVMNIMLEKFRFLMFSKKGNFREKAREEWVL